MLNKSRGGKCKSWNKNICDSSNNLDRINEKCVVCQKHFIRIEDVKVGICNDQYYHARCARELGVDVTECREI